MFGKAQFAKSRKKKPFTSLILTWLSIMYEVCFLDTPLRLIGLITLSNWPKEVAKASAKIMSAIHTLIALNQKYFGSSQGSTFRSENGKF